MAAITGLTLIKPRRRLGGHVSRPAQIEVCPDTGGLRLRQLDNGKGSPVRLHSLVQADIFALEDAVAVPASAREHWDDDIHDSRWKPVVVALPGKRLFLKGTTVAAVKQMLVKPVAREVTPEMSTTAVPKVVEAESTQITHDSSGGEDPANVARDETLASDLACGLTDFEDDKRNDEAEAEVSSQGPQLAPQLTIGIAEKFDSKVTQSPSEHSRPICRDTDNTLQKVPGDSSVLLSDLMQLPGVVSADVMRGDGTAEVEVVVVVTHRIHSYGLPTPCNSRHLTVFDECGECLRQDLYRPFTRSDNAWLEHRLRSEDAAIAVRNFVERTAKGQAWQDDAETNNEALPRLENEHEATVQLSTGSLADELHHLSQQEDSRHGASRMTEPDSSDAHGLLMLEVLSMSMEEERRRR